MSSTRSVEISSKQKKPPAPNAQVPESLWTNAFWHSPLRTVYDHHRIIFILRNFEDVSSVFGPNWHRMATRSGKYRAFDMNMPFSIPALSLSTCERDPPLTVYGKFCAQSIARSLRNQLFKLSFIVCAPSLRCVQTACTFGEVMETRVYVVEELAEPQITSNYGLPTAINGKYLSIEELRKCGFKVQGLKLEERRIPHSSESELRIMLRIARALRELTTKAPTGPSLIIGDALVLKIANSLANLHEGYTDPLQTVPFNVPSFELKEDTTEMDRYDFTQLNENFPFGTMNVFYRQKDGLVMRLPYLMPKITVVPGKEEKDKESELKAAKPENVLSIQGTGPVENHPGSEVSLDIL